VKRTHSTAPSCPPLERSERQRGPEHLLPSTAAVWAPIVAMFAVFLTLVVLGLTGSSTGALHGYFAPGTKDSQLVMGTPRLIRSDEWYVQSTWVISQVEQNYPRISNSFPGGTDASVPQDLPVRDWVALFEPHQWGFFLLPLRQALAVKWWTPSLLLCLSVFAFSILRLPRKPWAAFFLAVSAFLAPFVQWWFLSNTVYPIAWAFAVLAAVTALVRGHRRIGIVLSAAAGYLTVTTAIGIYVPFILAAAYPTLAVAVGIGLVAGREIGLVRALRRMIPLFAAGAAALIITLLWAWTRLDTIRAFLNTSYPGARSSPTGEIGKDGVIQLLTAPFQRDLLRTPNAGLIGINESESSSFVLIGLALVLPLAALAIRHWRRSREVDWITVSAVAVSAFMLAYQLIPGWDAVARLFLLDRVPAVRMRLGWGVLALIITVYALERFSDRELSRRWQIGLTGLSLLGTAVIVGVPWVWLVRHAPVAGTIWIGYIACALYVLVGLAASWRVPTVAALLLALVSGGLSWHVNPLYEGYFDMRTTPLAFAIEDVEAKDPGQWVVVGGSVPATVTVIETGQQGYVGTQGAPSPVMWNEIDPTNIRVYERNRLGQLQWVLGTGEPLPRNPSTDVIEMTFDPCGRFAQTYVEHVVSQVPIASTCMRLDRQVQEGQVNFLIYRVTQR